MRPPRWKALVDKSIAACCAAIEIYNKPVVPHREETFAILVVSAWELLLKARLIKEDGNKLEAVYEKESVRRKDGRPSRRKRVKRNRAGNPVTIGLAAAVHRCGMLAEKPLAPACRANLELLIEVRDNAVHFLNDDPELARKVNEVGTASLINYVQVVGDWFEQDLGAHRFAILPLAFDGVAAPKALKPPKRTQQAAKLLDHLERAAAAPPTSTVDERFTVAVRIETTIVGRRSPEAIPVKFDGGPTATKVELTEEEFRRHWPHDHQELVKRIRQRVPGLKLNRDFHAEKKTLAENPRHARIRYLDFNNPKSTKKTFYSDAMVDALAVRMKARMSGPATSTPAAETSASASRAGKD